MTISLYFEHLNTEMYTGQPKWEYEYIKPTFWYGCGSWILIKTNENALNIREMKIMKHILGPINETNLGD